MEQVEVGKAPGSALVALLGPFSQNQEKPERGTVPAWVDAEELPAMALKLGGMAISALSMAT